MKKQYSLLNNSVQVEIDLLNKTVSSILFKGEEMIEGVTPFFRLKFRNRDASHFYTSCDDFTFSSFENDVAHYVSKNADVFISITPRSNQLEWWIKVINHTSLLLEQVELMSLGFCPRLKDEGGKGEIDFPYNEGARVTSIRRRETSAFRYYDVDYPSLGIYSMYPNMISSPFMSYIHNGKGIYLGMHDQSCTPKHIDFRVIDNTLKTEMSVFTNVNYGEDYEMDFVSRMVFFEGNYFDACEIYREWFYSHKPDSLKTIKDKYDEFPKWYHESPVVVTYPVVGTRDSDLEMKPGGFYPYTNALPVINDLSKKMSSPIMVTLMQWESTAPWAPPYVWPPYGDVDNFYLFRDKLHESGNYLGLYTSGFGWTNKSFRRDYDKTEEFEKENLKDIMCTDSNGFMKSTIVDEIRFGYDVCPKLEKSKQLFIDEAYKMIDTGIDYVQILDQNHGGNPYFCYSDKHGHVPAPGKWQVEETRKILSAIDKKTCLLGCESAASEPYIDQLSFSDNRFILNHHIGEAIPMYSYIYHEFVNNFMGNQICFALSNERYSFTYRVAYSFICGDMFTLILDGSGNIHTAWCNDVIIDEKAPLALIKNLNEWRTSKFMKYLHLGKMVKPLQYKCGKKEFDFLWNKEDRLSFDAILSSSFTDGVETYQFFVNYDLEEEAFSLDDKEYLIYYSPDGQPVKKSGQSITVPPLSAIAIKMK